MIDILLDLGANLNGPPGEYGSVPHYAILSKDESVVKYILNKGSVIDDSKKQMGILARAIRANIAHLVPLLLEKGADPNQTFEGKSAISLAIEENKRDIFEVLVDHGAKFADTDSHLLMKAIRQGSLGDIKELLDQGLNVNCYNHYQWPIEVSLTIRNFYPTSIFKKFSPLFFCRKEPSTLWVVDSKIECHPLINYHQNHFTILAYSSQESIKIRYN